MKLNKNATHHYKTWAGISREQIYIQHFTLKHVDWQVGWKCTVKKKNHKKMVKSLAAKVEKKVVK